ncbi:hypothetical protein M3J07_006221 [Ascochyta lentis]
MVRNPANARLQANKAPSGRGEQDTPAFQDKTSVMCETYARRHARLGTAGAWTGRGRRSRRAVYLPSKRGNCEIGRVEGWRRGNASTLPMYIPCSDMGPGSTRRNGKTRRWVVLKEEGQVQDLESMARNAIPSARVDASRLSAQHGSWSARGEMSSARGWVVCFMHPDCRLRGGVKMSEIRDTRSCTVSRL